jgi:hypothetical protein
MFILIRQWRGTWQWRVCHRIKKDVTLARGDDEDFARAVGTAKTVYEAMKNRVVQQ